MTWVGLGRPKGSLPNTPGALARLARYLVPHRTLIPTSGLSIVHSPVDWAVGCSDQGDESSCEAHGKEKLIWGTAKAQGYAGLRGDHHGIYALRADDYPSSGPLPDEGAIDSTISAGLARFGVLPDGAGPADVSARLSFSDLETGYLFRVAAIARLDLGGEALIDALLGALARGCASFSMQVDASYEALTDGQTWSGPTGPSLGGHCQAIDAWRQGANGVEFGVEGSWGPMFGRVWIPLPVFLAVAGDVTIASIVPRIVSEAA